ncbi:carboxy terminal-processing peptidase [Chryseolinea lacunae]|uniref:Carboxy terminal-processing peptidase n=1 Tax=Chryseolinea lacunae TaxID=2801331 RepID=A0ABS1KYQ4_9BACT|nr:carboxy terminal-processing peptidase [Chryseolinea lacunae]MBL0743466.1 carboxy terminal-processing peptidase [Chryseolinea lacunae]
MKRTFFAAIFASVLGVTGIAQGATGTADTTALKPSAVYGKEAKVMAYILDNNHYRKINLNDSLSSAILDGYVKSLDNNKTYFTSADLAAFEKYRFKIDDLTRSENVDPAYEIYKVFKKRFSTRMNYVMTKLIPQSFDYSSEEYYETDRDKEPWCKNEAELDDVWRKIIKSQALSLKLAGKGQPEIEKTLKERYDRFAKSIQQFNSEDVFSMYMNSITEAYDPHTSYFSPKAADLFQQQMSLSLEGIGARLQTDNDYTRVAEVITGGPADKSKLVSVNDKIIGVAQGSDGEIVDVIGWRIDDVVKLIKGPKGTTVKLQILPAETGVTGPSKVITLVRDKIKLEDQRAKKSTINYQKNGKNLKLGIITLPSFYMDFEAYQKGDPNYMSTTRDVARLIKELQTEKIDGIVLDLRNNGGGSLTEAIDLTGLFIKDGPVVQVKNSSNKIDVGKDDDPSIAYNGPLVVMTNRFSASASEIFAGAIQDYKRGVIVGESTYGKGTVQTIVDLNRFINDPNNKVGELKITFQKFYRVTGSSTQHKGVTPDVAFPTALDAEQFGESSSASALPWDEIRGTLFQKSTMVNDRVVANLNKAYQDRLKTDVSLQRFSEDIADMRKGYKDTKISLNETVRKKEMEEAEKKKAANDKLGTKMVNKEGKPTNVLELDDIFLQEGLFVLGDLINTKVG